MRIVEDPTHRSAFVFLVEGAPGSNILITDDVVACVDEDGRLVALDVMNTTQFGTPFDEAAAQRAVAWTLERLPVDAAS